MLKTDDRVEIQKTESQMDGVQGVILGLSVDHISKIWIVGLDEPYSFEGLVYRAVTMPEACLRRI